MGIELHDISRFGKDAQAQIASKIAISATKSRKYKNKPATRGKLKFASQKEARRYDELALMLKAGKIRGLKLQPQFTLQEAYVTPENERIRAIRYVADFTYERLTEPDSTGRRYWLLVVEDVKSEATRTAQYKIKRKMFFEKYGFGVTEV